MTYQPRSMTWEERCAHLAEWVESTGRSPSQMSDDATERSCYSWLTATPMNLKSGKLTADQERLFRALPVSADPRNTITDRLDELERFYAKHGRLPMTTAVDTVEKSLATFLVGNLRRQITKGTLGKTLLKRAEAIPGVAEYALTPDQEKVLDELSEYAAQHGHMPPFGVSDNKQEYRLSSWIRNNTQGSPENKSPALRTRHEAIIRLTDRYPAASVGARERLVLRRGQLLRDLESYTKEHRHVPLSTRGADEELVRLAAALAGFREDLEAGRLSNEDQTRVKAVLAYPSARDFEWQVNFDALVNYAAAHDGRLPGNWAEGKAFSWLTIQRRQYRNGKMSEERLEKLRTIQGVIPGC